MSDFIAVEPKFYINTPKLDYVIEQLELTGGVPMADVIEMLKELREVIARVK